MNNARTDRASQRCRLASVGVGKYRFLKEREKKRCLSLSFLLVAKLSTLSLMVKRRSRIAPVVFALAAVRAARAYGK